MSMIKLDLSAWKMQTLIAPFFLFALLECVFRGYAWPKEPFWILRGLAYLGLVVLMGEVVAPWMYSILHPYAFIDLVAF